MHLNTIRSLFIFCALLLLSTCSENDDSIEIQNQPNNQDNQLIGDWHITERLADPGDGSGTFYPVNEDKTLTFLPNMHFESSSVLCYMITGSHDQGSGTYSITAKTITPVHCDIEVVLEFDLKDDELIIHYPCIEACAEKYTRTAVSN